MSTPISKNPQMRLSIHTNTTIAMSFFVELIGTACVAFYLWPANSLLLFFLPFAVCVVSLQFYAILVKNCLHGRLIAVISVISSLPVCTIFSLALGAVYDLRTSTTLAGVPKDGRDILPVGNYDDYTSLLLMRILLLCSVFMFLLVNIYWKYRCIIRPVL